MDFDRSANLPAIIFAISQLCKSKRAISHDDYQDPIALVLTLLFSEVNGYPGSYRFPSRFST
jgi:hypothetical protein